jgi:DOMON domain
LVIISTMATASAQNMKQAEVNGMIIKWYAFNGSVTFEVSAPTTGWVSLGFNSKNDIVGTNLVMGASIDSKCKVEEHYVKSIGVHKNAETFGSSAVITNYSCIEFQNKTILKFTIPDKASDRFHYNLFVKQKIWLICAYSMEDDFDHHSIMRQQIEVEI